MSVFELKFMADVDKSTNEDLDTTLNDFIDELKAYCGLFHQSNISLEIRMR